MNEPTPTSPAARDAAMLIQDEFKRLNNTCCHANFVVPGTNTLAPIIQSTIDKQLRQVEKERDDWKASSESWESTAKLVAKLPCGHPNDCAYDKNNDGRWANIGCVWCERDQLKAALEKCRIELLKCSVGACNCMTKSPDWQYHAESCRYKSIGEALSDPIVQTILKQTTA